MNTRSDAGLLTLSDVRPFLQNVKTSNGQLVAACPICEGGGKGHHLYLKEEGGRLLVYCQKCNAKGPELFKAFRMLGAKPTKQREPEAMKPKTKEVIEEYDHIYREPDGSEAYRKTRTKFSDGSKIFTFKHRLPSGSMSFKKPEGCNNLYNLDLMAKALKEHSTDTIYIVEGEKCADAMVSAGILATTSNTGAQKNIKLSETDRKYLTAFPVRIVIPDNDDKGLEYAAAWGDARVLSLPDIWPTCPKKGDVADYLLNGGNPEKILNYKFPVPDKLDREFFEGLDSYDMVDAAVLSAIYAIKDPAERSQVLALANLRAGELRVVRQFNSCWKAYLQSQVARNIVSDNMTRFPAQPFSLRSGEWQADVNGVKRLVAQQNADFRYETASPIPIMPVEVLCNVEDRTEKVRLAFFKEGAWETIIVPRSLIASNNKIIDLADFGIEVNSDNSKHLVKYLADTVAMNPDILPRVKSISHLGWDNDHFVPYTEDVKMDCEEQFKSIVNAMTEKGTVEEWAALVAPLRKNIYLRLIMAASFASPLISKVGALPFVLHLWGGTGSGKTVGMMVAASIWGNPNFGAMLRTMNMTVNSMMATAAVLKHVPFFGDELQTIKTRYDNYDTLIMRVCEGVDRGRMTNTILQKQATWANSFIFTGEEPCTQSVSGGGVQNRVIEIECDEQVVAQGNVVVNRLGKQYGTAGSVYIEALRKEKDLRGLYQYIFGEILKSAKTTEKQAMSMALMMLGDMIARQLFWPDEEVLTVAAVRPFLKDVAEIDVAERAYKMTMDLVSENQMKFDTEFASAKGGIVWGAKRGPELLFNKTVLERELAAMGFSWNAVKKKWAAKGYIETNSNGRYTRQTSVNGAMSTYVIFLRQM